MAYTGTYTGDDFTKKLAETQNSTPDFFMSQYDMDLAKKYPDFGMSILTLKQEFPTANEYQRLMMNEQANQLRSQYGNFTGGPDGSQYISTGKIPAQINSTLDQIGGFGSFSYGAYNDPYAQYQQSLLDSLLNRPAYNNQYAQHQQSLLDSILNRQEFSYAKEDDPQWASYKKSYLREGDRATANALAQTSAASGGRASSYAVNAATQAGDYYATKLNDVIPQLYQQAYNRYLNEYQMKHQDLGMVNNMEASDYQKYLSAFEMDHRNLGAVNAQQQQDYGRYTDGRDFAYNSYLNDYNMLNNYLGKLQGQDATDYSRYLDSVGMRLGERDYQDQQRQLEQENLYRQQLLGLNYTQAFGTVPDHYAPFMNMPAGTPTLGYAQYLDQIARAASGGGGGSYGGGSSGGNIDTASAVSAFTVGDHSDGVIEALLGIGYTRGDIEAAGYKGDYFGRNSNASQGASQGAAQIDWASVNALGYGPVSYETLERLVESGEVIAAVENGRVIFRRHGTAALPTPSGTGSPGMVTK